MVLLTADQVVDIPILDRIQKHLIEALIHIPFWRRDVLTDGSSLM